MKHSYAFSLIELGVSFIIIALLITFTIVSFQRAYEDADIGLVQSSLVIFQNVLIQGADRLKVAPKEVALTQVVQAIAPNANIKWIVASPPNTSNSASVFIKKNNQIFNTDGSQIVNENRGVEFRVNACGSLCPTTLYNFNYYELVENTGAICPEDTSFSGADKCKTIQAI